MSLKRIDLTTALRPSLLPDEILLFVQDNVGLYEGQVAPRVGAMPGGRDADVELANSRSQITSMATHI